MRWAWLAARWRNARARHSHRAGPVGGGYRLSVWFADADAALLVEYGDRDAALTRARELAQAGAWVSVFGGEHDLDARLVHLARLPPDSPRPPAWELIAEFPPGQGSAARRW